jgi:glycosyltransferase involved in cell wall biosynthesis
VAQELRAQEHTNWVTNCSSDGPWNPREFHIVGSEVRSDAAVLACDVPPNTEGGRDELGPSRDRGVSVTMSFGAISLDDEYVNFIDAPDGAGSDEERSEDALRICVVGSGTRFISGISYYTYYLSDALHETFDVSVVLMRRLLPRRLYPGRKRVGAHITDIETSSIVPTFDGVDWFAIPSLFRAGRFLRQQQPDVVVFQWWTGTVLHSFLYLLRVARRSGASVVLEFHEDQDSGETGVPLVERIVRPGLRHLIRSAAHYVVHSEWDKDRLGAKFALDPARVTVIPHGPYPTYGETSPAASRRAPATTDAADPEGGEEVTILFFGTIRPYKGAEDLVEAFNLLPRNGSIRWRLLAVGETWEGWELPAEKIRESAFAEDIEFVNRYVTDAELPDLFDRADIVALPYHRASASGPLHMTMHRGLPVVVTNVGGLSEAAADYSGTVFVPPENPVALAEGIVSALELRAHHHADIHTWDVSRVRYTSLIEGIRLARDHVDEPKGSEASRGLLTLQTSRQI